MESTTPFVGVIAPYGTPYLFGLARKAAERGKQPYVVVESEDAAVAFAQTFRLMYPHLKVGTSASIEESEITFVPQEVLLQRILSPFEGPPEEAPEDLRTDFTAHIFYVLPNLLSYSMEAYVILRVLEHIYEAQGIDIPSVTLLGVNSQNVPPLKSKIALFDKHRDTNPIDYQLVGKHRAPSLLYEEMAKLILQIHMETPGRTIAALVPSITEAETVIGLLQGIEVDKLYIQNVYESGEWKMDPMKQGFTTVYVASGEVEPLLMIPIDIVVDSFRFVQPTNTLSGMSTTVSTTSTRDISLSRCSLIQNKRAPFVAGTCYILTNKTYFDLEQRGHFPQSITRYVLMLGKTSILAADIFPDHPSVHTEFVQLQAYGALNPDQRTTAMGTFLLDVPLAAGEAAVLWLYLQEVLERDLTVSCLPALITTSMISLFSEERSYYVYPPSKSTETGDYFYEREQHRKKKWDLFAGADDLETFLNIWFRMVADLNTFDPTYNDVTFWSKEHSLNGDQLFVVVRKIQQLKRELVKHGFECDRDAIDPKADAAVLRKIYSQIYLLKLMQATEEDVDIYQSITDQQFYTIDHTTSINTTAITVPPAIVAPLTVEQELLVVVLYRT